MSGRWLRQDPCPGSPPPNSFLTRPLPFAIHRHLPLSLPQFTPKNSMVKICNHKCKLLNRLYKIVIDFCASDLPGAPTLQMRQLRLREKGSCSSFCSYKCDCDTQCLKLPVLSSLVNCFQLICVGPESAPRLPVGSNCLIYFYLEMF